MGGFLTFSLMHSVKLSCVKDGVA